VDIGGRANRLGTVHCQRCDYRLPAGTSPSAASLQLYRWASDSEALVRIWRHHHHSPLADVCPRFARATSVRRLLRGITPAPPAGGLVWLRRPAAPRLPPAPPAGGLGWSGFGGWPLGGCPRTPSLAGWSGFGGWPRASHPQAGAGAGVRTIIAWVWRPARP
jgi:hypothetical protein